MTTSIEEAAQKRAEAAEKSGTQARSCAPSGVEQRRAAPVLGQMRAGGTVERDGKSFLKLSGMASTYEKHYLMYDLFGMYQEVVAEAAGAASLAQEPDVVYLLNHTGIPFARSTSGTLDLSEPGGGLWTEAYLNPKRQDVKDLVAAVTEKSITEMSFAFRITDGRWSPDYTEYRINTYDIDRGDTSPVTFGANPHTSIEARAAQFALTNDLLRAARSFDESQRELLADALDAASTSPTGQASARIGAKAAQRLRQLGAELAQGGPLDAMARASLAAVITDLVDGTGKLAGDGPLDVVLGLRSVPAEAPAQSAPMRLDFLERELAAARQL